MKIIALIPNLKSGFISWMKRLLPAPVNVESGRLVWIDALRGLLIILVVWFHLELCWSPDYDGSPNNWIMHFRMPTFFFIMGYFSAVCYGGVSTVRHKLKRRLEVQLVPTLIFTTIFLLLYQPDLGSFFINKFKFGLWFTWSAVVSCCIYSGLWCIGNLLRLSHGFGVIFVVIGAMTLYLLTKTIPLPEALDEGASWSQTMLYLPFYLLGIVCREYAHYFHALLHKGWFVAGCGIVAVIWSVVDAPGFPLPGSLFIPAGIVFAWGLFYHMSGIIHNSRCGRLLADIGRYTLEIYLVQALLFGIPGKNLLPVPAEWGVWAQFGVRFAVATVMTVVIYGAVRMLPAPVLRLLFGRRSK